MHEQKNSKCVSPSRLAVVLAAALALSGCGLSRRKLRFVAPRRLPRLAEPDLPQMVEEETRLAAVRALNGKVDIQFLDNSFAECGIAEKYRTADGRLVTQRPGQVYLLIAAPIIGTKIAEMSSNGQRFWAAVYQGDEKYRRFVTGTNSATYVKLEADGKGASPDCAGAELQRPRAVVDGRGLQQPAALRRGGPPSTSGADRVDATAGSLLDPRHVPRPRRGQDRPAAARRRVRPEEHFRPAGS